MIKIDNCDIYELGATDNEEKLVISDFVVEITKYPDNIQQGVSALRGRVLKIYPKTIDAQTLRQTHEYEIRNKDELSAYRFQLSQFGIPIEHGADFTAVKIK